MMKEKKDKPVKVKETKPRADKYEEKVSFNGTFDDLLNISVQPKQNKSMTSKTHTSDEIRLAYTISPTSVKNKVKLNDKIYVDEDWVEEIEGILKKCGIGYDIITIPIALKNNYEITIK